jgi:CheY-like chemotaxis protein
VRLAYQQLLEHNGFQVTTAGTIGEATQKAAQTNYDLVIVDYYLPDGNGDELCRRLSSKPGAPALAIITGTYREDVIKRCLEAGATECMFKNEAKELFLARVRTLSRQIQMQKSVEADRRRLDGILGSVGDGVYGVDGTGVITFINPTALRLLGYPTMRPSSARTRTHDPLRGRGRAATERGRFGLSRAYARGEPLKATRPCSGNTMATACRSNARCCRWRSSSAAKVRSSCSATFPNARAPSACAGKSATIA